jgi:hypothetical protein
MSARRIRVVGIYRDRAYSPFQHFSNDAAILDATLGELAGQGWEVERVEEPVVPGRSLPPADLYLNMAQGRAASRALLPREREGRRFFNRPSSVLRCHRQRMVPALLASGFPFPRTVLVRTDRALEPALMHAFATSPKVWLKRGGVHAEQEGDVRLLAVDELGRGLAELAERRIRVAAVQDHLEGPVVKFYGVAGGALFHAYVAGTKAPVTSDLADLGVLRDLAFRAAAQFRLDIFGGDFVIDAARGPTLIDLNDWPSFAPVRIPAARAIAGYVRSTRLAGVLR